MSTVQVTRSASLVQVTATRPQVTVGTPSVVAHNALTNRSDADQHPATAITNTPAGAISATTVQAAINELDTEKAPLASPALTGVPTAPTAAADTSTTQIATTAFAKAEADAAQAASQPLEPITVSGSTTATINRTHIVVATATLTDPSPAEARGFEVIVRNGTATVGGTAYAAGLKIRRYYHSGAWANAVEPSWGGTPTATRLAEWDSAGNIINSAIADTITGGVATLAGALGANRTYTLPDAAITVAGINLAQTWTATQTMGSNAGILADATQGVNSGSTASLLRLSGGTASNGGTLILTGSTHPTLPSRAIMRITGVDVMSWESTIATSTIPLAVPNGTAAAPGLRLTSEASGLYRVSATSMGFAVAGTAAASLTSGGIFTATRFSTSTADGVMHAQFLSTTGQLQIYGYNDATNGAILNSYNAASSAFLPLSLQATVVRITQGTASVSTATGALVITTGGLGVEAQATIRRIAYGTGTIATTGAIASLASDDGFTRLTGAAPDVQGIANPGASAARVIFLYCVNATTLRHENGTAAAADRITSDTAADIAVAAGKTVELIYDPTSSRWRPVRY